MRAAGFDIVENLESETGAFGFFDPQPEHFLLAAKADASYGLDAFLEHALFGAYGHAQGVHKDDRVNTL